MTKEHKKLMRKVARRLDKYVEMMQTHCGHEPGATLAMQEGEKFLEWLGDEIAKLGKAE